MGIPNLHDRRALEEIVSRMDTEVIARSVREGGLSAFAEEVAMDELAQRVLAEEVDYGPGACDAPAWFLWLSSAFAGFAFLVWLGWAVSLVYAIVTSVVAG